MKNKNNLLVILILGIILAMLVWPLIASKISIRFASKPNVDPLVVTPLNRGVSADQWYCQLTSKYPIRSCWPTLGEFKKTSSTEEYSRQSNAYCYLVRYPWMTWRDTFYINCMPTLTECLANKEASKACETGPCFEATTSQVPKFL